jgi:hypothetical protein
VFFYYLDFPSISANSLSHEKDANLANIGLIRVENIVNNISAVTSSGDINPSLTPVKATASVVDNCGIIDTAIIVLCGFEKFDILDAKYPLKNFESPDPRTTVVANITTEISDVNNTDISVSRPTVIKNMGTKIP